MYKSSFQVMLANMFAGASLALPLAGFINAGGLASIITPVTASVCVVLSLCRVIASYHAASMVQATHKQDFIFSVFIYRLCYWPAMWASFIQLPFILRVPLFIFTCMSLIVNAHLWLVAIYAVIKTVELVVQFTAKLEAR